MILITSIIVDLVHYYYYSKIKPTAFITITIIIRPSSFNFSFKKRLVVGLGFLTITNIVIHIN